MVQNALLTAWDCVASFPKYQAQDAFVAWLHGHLDNHLARCIVAQAKRRETSLPASTIFELCDGPDAPHWEQDGWREQRQELYQRLHNFTLTPKQRERTLMWIAGNMTLRQIAAAQLPPVSPNAVWKSIQQVGRIIKSVDDADAYDKEIGELIENQPAALTYACQMQRDNRVRREANMFYMKRALMREASRVAPRVKPLVQAVGNRKQRRAA